MSGRVRMIIHHARIFSFFFFFFFFNIFFLISFIHKEISCLSFLSPSLVLFIIVINDLDTGHDSHSFFDS